MASSNGIRDIEDQYCTSDDEDIEELQEKICKVEMLLKKLKTKMEKMRRKGQVNDSTTDRSEQKDILNRQKKITRVQDSVIHKMYDIMKECGVQGFVLGFIPENGKAVAHASPNLRSWWKNEVQFHQTGPAALIKFQQEHGPNPDAPSMPRVSVTSTPVSLLDLSDSTIGSLLSALLQNCDPPQRKFPLKEGVAPPWWPKGTEEWWPELGFEGGAPIPYRKPHDLKKAMKVGVLIAVIRHMSPDFEKIKTQSLVYKSLHHNMTANDIFIWDAVLSHEQGLVSNDNPGSDAVLDHGLKRKSPLPYEGNPEETFESSLKRPMIIPDFPPTTHDEQVASNSERFNGGGQLFQFPTRLGIPSDMAQSFSRNDLCDDQNPDFDHSFHGDKDVRNDETPSFDQSSSRNDMCNDQNPNFDHSFHGKDDETPSFDDSFYVDDLWDC